MGFAARNGQTEDRDMQNDRFEMPIAVKSGSVDGEQLLRTAQEASQFLLTNWPGKRSPKYRAALQACHDAVSGEKPAMNARRAFVAAGREADVLAKDKP